MNFCLPRARMERPIFAEAAINRVMQQAEQQIKRERSWFRASGFELDGSLLPSIDDVLKA